MDDFSVLSHDEAIVKARRVVEAVFRGSLIIPIVSVNRNLYCPKIRLYPRIHLISLHPEGNVGVIIVRYAVHCRYRNPLIRTGLVHYG